jgi:hypothetical protein
LHTFKGAYIRKDIYEISSINFATYFSDKCLYAKMWKQNLFVPTLKEIKSLYLPTYNGMPRMICTRWWQTGIHRVKGAAAGPAAGIKLHRRIGRRRSVLAGQGTNNNAAAAGALAAGGLPRARNGLSQRARIRRHRAAPLVMLLLMSCLLLLLLLLLRGELMVMMMVVMKAVMLRALRVLGRVTLAAGGHWLGGVGGDVDEGRAGAGGEDGSEQLGAVQEQLGAVQRQLSVGNALAKRETDPWGDSIAHR